MPLVFYADPETRLDHAFVGWWEERSSAGCTPTTRCTTARRWPAGCTPSTPSREGDLRFERIPGHELDLEAHSALFSGEQSNSSVFFGEDSMLKVFRKITPGINPDIAIHEVLTEAGSEHVAKLYGWVEADTDDGLLHLAMLQQFLRTATDGWELALTSVRNLFAEADLHADEVGGDFAGEAARLGTALAEVHETLAESFETGTMPAAEVAEAMRARLGRGGADRARAGVVRRAAARRLRRAGRARRAGGAADPRRPAPRPDPAHGARLEGRRLRGRAGQAALRAGAARLPLARRRRDDALLRLRRARGRSAPSPATTTPPPPSGATAPTSGRPATSSTS